MIGRFVLAAAALLVAPAAASAQDAEKPIDEIAADLAYGFCPLFLADQLALTGNPQLAALGFDAKVQKLPHPRFGEFEQIGLKRADGEIGFGGAAGKACNVVVMGPKREAALARLRSSMRLTGLDFKPATNVKTPAITGVTIETFKAPVEGQFLYVQLIQAGGPTPMVSAQLFGMEE
ncbi:MAG: hypothetical protein EOP60_05535 [Sphingomonadales bacterium]|nr:MAG: hypothetical protein EOP60_05535 [Sphingomonadales bacterium]